MLRANDVTQPIIENSFGSLPTDALQWEYEGHRHWLASTHELPSLVSYGLTGSYGSSWSNREPWLLLGGEATRVPAAGEPESDGCVWINAAGRRAPVPRRLATMLHELVYEDELRELEEWAERREEPVPEPIMPPPTPATAHGPRRLLAPGELAGIVRGSELIEGLGMCSGDLAVIYGPSGAGKSFAALGLAFSVASGTSWHEREVESGAVLYIAAEGPETLTERRLAWEAHHGSEVGPAFATYRLPGDLTTPAGLEQVSHDLLQDLLRPRLIVIDTLSASLAGHDENSSAAMSALVDNARSLAQRFDACVLLVHHTGKDTSRGPRGHGSLFAASDTVLAAVPSSGRRLRLQVEKRRDGPSGEKMALRLTDVALEGGYSCVLVADDEQTTATTGVARAARCSLVVESLTALGGEAASKSELWKAMREDSGTALGKDPAFALIATAVDAGDVMLVPEGRRTGVRLAP